MAINKLSRQEDLVTILNEVFPNTQAHIGSKKHANIKYPDTGAYIELDVWIPDLYLCFEFQDPYHYVSTWYTQTTLAKVQHADYTKKNLVLQHNLTLIAIPCWWDGSIKSLVPVIHFHRPELLNGAGDLISLNPPLGYFPPKEIPEVGELMLASFPTDTFNLTEKSWWMGEKYDGVRCCWNPTQRTFYSRTGRHVSLLTSAEAIIPNTFIDGEFWFGRGEYHATYPLCKDSTEPVSWHTLRLASFDLASPALHKAPFEDRYEKLLASLDPEHPFCVVAMRVQCQDTTHVERMSKCAIDGGGEGVMLRMASSQYIGGRNQSLVKLKAAQCDSEGRVIEVSREEYVVLQLPNKQTLTVPWENIHASELVEGDVVTFSYDLHSRKELPLNPVILRKRLDLEWDDIVHNFAYQKVLNVYSQVGSTPRQNQWKSTTMRNTMASIVKKIPVTDAFQLKSARTILQKIEGSVPSMKLLILSDVDAHTTHKSAAWNMVSNRRKFFENFAAENRFEPLVASNWYSQPREKILSTSGATGVLSYHNGSITQALLSLFPDIGLVEEKFNKTLLPTPRVFYQPELRRNFFENYARTQGFNPLEPLNWYSHPREQILSVKGARRVMHYHNNSITQALVDLFPGIGIDKKKFSQKFFART